MSPIIQRARSGLEPIDEHFGGVYRKASVLCAGTPRSGKTLVGLQFAAQGLADRERTLLIRDAPHAHLLALAALLGIDLDAKTREGAIVLLHSDQVDAGPSRDHFEPIQRLLDTNRIGRLVLDPVLPWIVEPADPAPLADVISFVDCLADARVTALLTLPWAGRLAQNTHQARLFDLVPVCVSLRRETDAIHALSIRRYLGANPPAGEFTLAIRPGRGLALIRK